MKMYLVRKTREPQKLGYTIRIKAIHASGADMVLTGEAFMYPDVATDLAHSEITSVTLIEEGTP